MFKLAEDFNSYASMPGSASMPEASHVLNVPPTDNEFAAFAVRVLRTAGVVEQVGPDVASSGTAWRLIESSGQLYEKSDAEIIYSAVGSLALDFKAAQGSDGSFHDNRLPLLVGKNIDEECARHRGTMTRVPMGTELSADTVNALENLSGISGYTKSELVGAALRTEVGKKQRDPNWQLIDDLSSRF